MPRRYTLSSRRRKVRSALATLSVKSHKAYHKARKVPAVHFKSKSKTMARLRKITKKSQKLNKKYVTAQPITQTAVQKVNTDLTKAIKNA